MELVCPQCHCLQGHAEHCTHYEGRGVSVGSQLPELEPMKLSLLELVSVEDLVDELERRFEASVFIGESMHGKTRAGEPYTRRYCSRNGPSAWVCGLAELAKQMAIDYSLSPEGNLGSEDLEGEE